MQDVSHYEVSSALTRDLLKEKRADRRWRNIRFICWFLLFSFSLMHIFRFMHGSTSATGYEGNQKYVSLIHLDGMIAPGRDFSGSEILAPLREAFADKKAEGVIIDINSPGGTPVQAAIIHDAILAFKKQYHKKVIVVGEDMLTSGAYFVAVAGDKIYVNPSTLTGSIGVIVKGFGFVDIMKKIGIERRVYTAGENKDRLDPFLPQNPEDQLKIQEVMSEVHQNFVDAVKTGRQGKIKLDNAALFSGDFWAGETAKKLGLVDETGNLLDAMQKEFHTTHYKEYSGNSNLWRSLSGQFTSLVDSTTYSL